MTTPIGQDTMRVNRVWAPGTWEDADFHSMWPDLGGPGLAVRDLWLDVQPKHGRSALVALEEQADGALIKLTGAPLMPGIYVFTHEELLSIPLVANNRAHSAAPEFVQTLMRKAVTSGRFIPLPLWFAHFAESAPPNLYGQQRSQFEALFAPRARAGVPATLEDDAVTTPENEATETDSMGDLGGGLGVDLGWPAEVRAQVSVDNAHAARGHDGGDPDGDAGDRNH